MKQEIWTDYYEHCGECPHVEEAKKGWKCFRKRKVVDLWGEIPSWCPLEDKEEGK